MSENNSKKDSQHSDGHDVNPIIIIAVLAGLVILALIIALKDKISDAFKKIGSEHDKDKEKVEQIKKDLESDNVVPPEEQETPPVTMPEDIPEPEPDKVHRGA